MSTAGPQTLGGVARKSTSPAEPAPLQELALHGDHRLVVERGTPNDVVKVLAADGQIRLYIDLTPAGPVLRVEGCSLLIEAAGDLAIDAERIALRGRGGVALASGGDVAICAAGRLDSTATIQQITATLGNVNVKANDDVKLKGERIKMNCD